MFRRTRPGLYDVSWRTRLPYRKRNGNRPDASWKNRSGVSVSLTALFSSSMKIV